VDGRRTHRRQSRPGGWGGGGGMLWVCGPPVGGGPPLLRCTIGRVLQTPPLPSSRKPAIDFGEAGPPPNPPPVPPRSRRVVLPNTVAPPKGGVTGGRGDAGGCMVAIQQLCPVVVEIAQSGPRVGRRGSPGGSSLRRDIRARWMPRPPPQPSPVRSKGPTVDRGRGGGGRGGGGPGPLHVPSYEYPRGKRAPSLRDLKPLVCAQGILSDVRGVVQPQGSASFWTGWSVGGFGDRVFSRGPKDRRPLCGGCVCHVSIP